ncbi:MAG: DUF342 domain-containing protein, partial [Lachnospiraceae bacterium]|nr:DUF342 domain-containing protein [Lachnospiraceae bacterium]
MEKDWVVLKIDEGRMWASLSIKEPIGEEAPYFSPEFIERYLRDNGITAGIDKEAVGALSNCVAYGQDIIVARGKAPVNGRDGVYNFTVTLEDAKSKPTIRPDGTVDYYNSLKLAMVEEGDTIAVYEPATSGEYGYTIFSEMVPPVKGRELRPLRGKGFVYNEDDRRYIASYGGRIYRQAERIIIDKVYFVKGDLDIEQGNIKFNGDVEIRGDVRSGLTIETDGNIFVHGHVGGCNLTAGESITIQRGIQGRDKCLIVAGKDVACSFVERCIIKAGGNVYADSILDSEVFARQTVNVCSKKGMIVGSEVTGLQGITAKTAGNDTGIATNLRAGVHYEDLVRISELNEKAFKLKQAIELLEKNLKIYDSLDGSKITKETESMRMKILRAKVVEVTELKSVQEEIHRLEEEIEQARKEARIHITGIV